MKRIIEGKRYDTETASEIHRWSNGYGSNDFKYCWESLYKTPRGNWFIAGQGGAMSKYSQTCGNNSWCGGSGLQPVSPGEAKAWLESHEGDDALEEHFASEIEDA